MTRKMLKAQTLLLAALILTAGWATLARLDFQAEGSKIQVKGTSTVHDWTCDVKGFTGSIEAGQATTALEALSHATLTVPVSSLECKNGQMNKKAYEALKSAQHPTIQYTLQGAQVQSEGADGWTTLQATGQLKIAGVQKPVTMTVKGRQLDNGSFRFTGSTPVQMSDFGVTPPTAMLGTMKTGNRVTISFDVVAR